MIANDFNAHLRKDGGRRVCGDKNAQRTLLLQLIHRARLYPISVSSLAILHLCINTLVLESMCRLLTY